MHSFSTGMQRYIKLYLYLSIAYLCMNVHSQSTMDGLHASSQPIEYLKYVKFCTFPNIKNIAKMSV